MLAYGLGDYCAAQEGETNASLALTVEFTRTGESTVISNVRCTPLATADCGAGDRAALSGLRCRGRRPAV